MSIYLEKTGITLDELFVDDIRKIPIAYPDLGIKNIGEYLRHLLLALWEDGEDFSSKRPFGVCFWKTDVYIALYNARLNCYARNSRMVVMDLNSLILGTLFGGLVMATSLLIVFKIKTRSRNVIENPFFERIIKIQFDENDAEDFYKSLMRNIDSYSPCILEYSLRHKEQNELIKDLQEALGK